MRRNHPISKFFSVALILSILHSSFYPLAAVPTYQERAQSKVQSTMDRADRLGDETAWNNYVMLGIVTEQAEWEEEASDEMRLRLRSIEGSSLSRAEKDAAITALEAEIDAERVQWEADAEAHILGERGKFRASKEDMAMPEVSEAAYDAMIAEAEAAVLASADLDLGLWESALETAHQTLVTNFDTALSGKLNAARTRVIADASERASFEAELDRIAAEVRREFETRDSFFLKRAKNQYIQLKRADDVSAKLLSDAASAESITQALIEDTEAAAAVEVQTAIDSVEGPDSVELFGKRVEDSIQAGLLLWQKAEEDLYAKRLTWMEEYKKSRSDAEAVWKANHEKIKEARAQWVRDAERQIADGRRQYEEKFAAFRDSRDRALAELTTFADGELSRRNEISARTGDMIRGGGAALAQAKDAYNYYNDLVSRLGAPVRSEYGTREADYNRDLALYNFYVQERNTMQAAIASFSASLTASEGVLRDSLHSNLNSTGLLVDRRIFAGDLPAAVAGLSSGSFKAELQDLMQARREDFVLYARDVTGLIASNQDAMVRIAAVRDGTQALFAGASDKAGLVLVAMTIAEGQERSEILSLIQKARGGTEAEQVAAIQAEIAKYFTVGTDENASLRAKTLSYFQSAGSGAYTTANENDPYLMTQAETDWELLRRDRAALSRRLRRAEEVKRYADLAKSHSAGLEMAALTEERASVMRVHADLAEVLYLAAKGDVAMDPALRSDPAQVDAALTQILTSRGISVALLSDKAAVYADVSDFADSLSGGRPDPASLLALIDRGETLAGRSEIAAALRDKLIALRDSAGQDAATLDARWAVIVSAASASAAETRRLSAELGVSEAQSTIDKIRTALSSQNAAEGASDLAARRAQLEASARALSEMKAALDEKKSVYQAAYIDFKTIASGSAEDLIRIEITEAVARLGAVVHGMQTIAELPGMSGRLSVPERERARSVLEGSQAESAQRGLASVSSGLAEFTALRAAKERTAVLSGITSGFAGKTGKEAADQVLAAKASLLPSGDDAPGSALRTAILNLEALRGEISSVEAQIAAAAADELPALELLRASLDLRSGHAARALVEIAQEEEAARVRLFNSWLNATAVTKDEADIKLREEALLSRAETLDSQAITMAKDLLNANKGKTSAEVAAAARDLLSGASADATPGNQASQDDRIKRARAAEMVGSVLAYVDEANKPVSASDARTVNEKWNALIGSISDAETASQVRTNLYGSVPTSMGSAAVTSVIARQTALKAIVDGILAGPAGGEYAAFQALAAADRSDIALYGNVRLDTPRTTLEEISKALDAQTKLTDARTVYLNETVRRTNQSLSPLVKQNAELVYLREDLSREAKARETERAGLVTARDAESDPVLKANLSAQIASLDSVIADLKSRIDAIRTQEEALAPGIQELSSRLLEASSRGSSTPALAGTFEMMRGDSARLQLLMLERTAEDPRVAARTVVNEAAGTDLAVWVRGARTTRDVTAMADRIVLWLSDETKTKGLDAGVKLAVEQVSTDLRRAALAKARIENRASDPSILRAEQDARLAAVAKREKALAELEELEGNLANAIASGGSFAGLKMGSLASANFAGDADLQTRANNVLSRLADAARARDRIAAAVAAGEQNQRLLLRGASGAVDVAADRTLSTAALKTGEAQGILGTIAAGDGFTAELIAKTGSLPDGLRMELLSRAMLSTNSGEALKAELKAFLDARDSDRLNTFGLRTAEAEKNAAGLAARVHAEGRADFEAAVNEFAATLSDPALAAAVLAKARRGEVVDALLGAETGAAYVEADVPAHVREVVLSRSMAKIEARFQALSGSGVLLDVGGVPEQFAKYAIARRLSERQAELTAYLAANAGSSAKGWVERELLGFAGVAPALADFAADYAKKLQSATAPGASTYLPGTIRPYSEVKADAKYAFLGSLLDGDQGLNDASLLFAEQINLGETEEAEKEFALARKEKEDADAALAGLLEANAKSTGHARDRIRHEREIAQGLLAFADELSVPLEQRKIKTDRTFPGAASSYQEAEYQAYVADKNAAGETPVSRAEYFAVSQTGAAAVPGTEGQSASTVLGGDYDGVLLTDPFATTTVVTANGTVEVRSRYQITPNTSGSTADTLQEVFYASLANEYVEAASDLERSMQRLAAIAGFSDDQPDTRTALKTAIDAAANDADREALLTSRKQELAAEAADHSPSKFQGLLSAAENAMSERASASAEYAEAARRQLLRSLGATQFIQNVFETASDELAQAQTDFDAASAVLAAERDVYMAQNARYTAALDATSRAYTEFTGKREAYETALQVQEFANTPYLYSSNSGEESFSQDANEEYNRSMALYQEAQDRLAEQTILVAAQDRLSEFSQLADRMAAGETFAVLSDSERMRLAELTQRKAMPVDSFGESHALTAAEETELAELRTREMYEIWGTTIQRRAEHISHSLRMIRIEKAATLVQGEVARREAIAAEAKQRFDRALETNFGMSRLSSDPATRNQQIAARNAVYKRLANIDEATNGTGFYNEYRSWFWGGSGWFSAYGGSTTSTYLSGQPQNVQITFSQQIEALVGVAGAAGIPDADKQAIGTWMGAGGNLAEFTGFSGVYYGFLAAAGVRDIKMMENLATKAIYIPLMQASMLQFAYAQSLQAAAAALGPFGVPMAISAGAIRAAAVAQYNLSQQMLLRSEAQFAFAQATTFWTQMAALASARSDSIRNVRQKEIKYEEAQAAVDYFTKIPDLKTLKERLIQWGAQHGDDDSANNLYDISDEDLKYLFFVANGEDRYVNSDGSATSITAAEKADAINLTSKTQVESFRDSLGRRYDPATLRGDAPGPLQGGVYAGADGNYTRVRVMSHNGSTSFQYAKIIDANPTSADTPENTRSVFNLSEISRLITEHGNTLLGEKKAAYIAAGDAAASERGDTAFLLAERDATFSRLFEAAGSQDMGGREFAGYTKTYADYEANGARIGSTEVQQRTVIQRKEWEIREQELVEKREAWEEKVAGILSRGRSQFAANEDRYLMEWRKWSREQDVARAEAEKQWKQKIDETMAAKVAWKTQAQEEQAASAVSRTMQETLSALNSQIQSIRQNAGIQVSAINVNAAINETVAQIKAAQPKSERLQEINKEIAAFNTRIATSEIQIQSEGSLTAVERGFTALMQNHAREMSVLANVKTQEQYRKIILDFMEQFQDQNQKIELQTASAAGSAGYNRAGGIYVKAGDKTAGVVHAYTFFDTKGAINEALAAAGFSEKTGDELVDFLKNKSDTEVNAYFKMQQTALSLAFEKVAGKGSGVERETSRDERIIGKFGKWAGKQQDSSTANQLVTHGGPGADPAKAQQAGDFLSFIALSGFGELGETGLRPSSVGPGFYVELELSNRFFGQEMARQQMKGMGTLDPASTFINQYNPVAMLAQATQNVRLATLSGKNEGYMWEAQALNMAKAPIVATGSAMMMFAMASASFTGPAAAALFAGGVAVSALGNSINVNPTTGERMLKMDDRAAITTAASAVTSFIGGTSAFAKLSDVMKVGFSATTAAGQASVRYDSEGRSQGISLTSRHGDMHGENALISAAVAAGTSYASGALGGKYGGNTDMTKAMFGDILSTGTNVLVEYGKQQTWGTDKSNYESLTKPDAGRLGAFTGLFVQDKINKAAIEGTVALVDLIARKSNEHDKARRLMELLWGGATEQQRRKRYDALGEGDILEGEGGRLFWKGKDGNMVPLDGRGDGRPAGGSLEDMLDFVAKALLTQVDGSTGMQVAEDYIRKMTEESRPDLWPDERTRGFFERFRNLMEGEHTEANIWDLPADPEKGPKIWPWLREIWDKVQTIADGAALAKDNLAALQFKNFVEVEAAYDFMCHFEKVLQEKAAYLVSPEEMTTRLASLRDSIKEMKDPLWQEFTLKWANALEKQQEGMRIEIVREAKLLNEMREAIKANDGKEALARMVAIAQTTGYKYVGEEQESIARLSLASSNYLRVLQMGRNADSHVYGQNSSDKLELGINPELRRFAATAWMDYLEKRSSRPEPWRLLRGIDVRVTRRK